MSKAQEKINTLNDELNEARKKQTQAESKCGQLTADRLKYINLSAQLAQENKKLYKRWFNARRSGNKAALTERLRRSVQNTHRKVDKQTQQQKYDAVRKETETRVRQLLDELRLARSRNDELGKTRLDLDTKINTLSEENTRIKRDVTQLELRIKTLKSQNENLVEEVRKKDAELKEREKSMEKQEEQIRDELRKSKKKKLIFFSFKLIYSGLSQSNDLN